MSSHRLDIEKLNREIEARRGAGTPEEVSFRAIAKDIGVGSSMFTRLREGFCPDADSLCSLLMWLDPQAPLADYTLQGNRPRPGPGMSRRPYQPPVLGQFVVTRDAA